MQGYMMDATEMFAAYTALGGGSTLDAYKAALKLFFFHTLNSHVHGLTPADYGGAEADGTGFALHSDSGAAEDALMEEAGIDEEEVDLIFSSVDAVHPYS